MKLPDIPTWRGIYHVCTSPSEMPICDKSFVRGNDSVTNRNSTNRLDDTWLCLLVLMDEGPSRGPFLSTWSNEKFMPWEWMGDNGNKCLEKDANTRRRVQEFDYRYM